MGGKDKGMHPEGDCMKKDMKHTCGEDESEHPRGVACHEDREKGCREAPIWSQALSWAGQAQCLHYDW